MKSWSGIRCLKGPIESIQKCFLTWILLLLHDIIICHILLTLLDLAVYSLNSSMIVLDMDISLSIPSSLEVNSLPHSIYIEIIKSFDLKLFTK